jgi:hypothetical protein
MESLSIAISAPPELPRSKMRSTAMAVSGRARSRATRRRTYSARDTPSSLARLRARRCTSFSSVIWVRDIMMATSYHCSGPRLRFNLRPLRGQAFAGRCGDSIRIHRHDGLSCCNRYAVTALASFGQRLLCFSPDVGTRQFSSRNLRFAHVVVVVVAHHVTQRGNARQVIPSKRWPSRSFFRKARGFWPTAVREFS